jgi:hypothetical protein
MAAYGQITSGYWPAMLIGVVLLLTFVATTTAAVTRGYRRRREETAPKRTVGLFGPLPLDMGASLWRCGVLLEEAVIVRQRLSGTIDAETYQARMSDLARQVAPEGHSQRNA